MHQSQNNKLLQNNKLDNNSTNITSRFNSPKVIKKGDYYYDRRGKVELLHLRDQFVVKGSKTEGEEAVKEVLKARGLDKGRKGQDLFTIEKFPGDNLFLYQFPEVGEEDLATNLIKDLKKNPKVHSVYPAFFQKESGLRLFLTNELLVELKAGYTEGDLVEIMPLHLEIKKVLSLSSRTLFVISVINPKEKDILEISRWLSENKIIKEATPNFWGEIRPLQADPFYPLQWHLDNPNNPAADVDANQAWSTPANGANIVVAIIDTGVEISHIDLDLNIWVNQAEFFGTPGVDDDVAPYNGYVDDIYGWDFVNDTNNVDPTGNVVDGHGTCCAGVCGAISNNQGGLGVAPSVTILPIKTIQDGSPIIPIGDFVAAIEYAWRRADILSCSFWYPDHPQVEQEFVDAATLGRDGLGCPVFVATGNSADGFMTGWSWIDANPHTYEWRYVQDGPMDPNLDNRVWLDNVIFPDGTRVDFNQPGLPPLWDSGSRNINTGQLTGKPWTVADDHRHYHYGSDVRSVQSGTINTGEYSFIRVTYDPAAVTVPMEFHFWTETANNNRLEFYFDGALAFSWLGTGFSEYHRVPTDPNISYPARYPSTIAVGSCTNHNFRSHYSCFGPALDFLAPSDGGTLKILTTDLMDTPPAPQRGWAVGDFTTTGFWDGFGGTSSACPLAAGIGALLLSREPNLTAIEVRQRLRDTADKIGPVPYDPNGRNNYYGYGKVNAHNALKADIVFSNQVVSSGTHTGNTITLSPNVTIVSGSVVNFKATDSISAGFNFTIEQDSNVTFKAKTIMAYSNCLIRSSANVVFEASDYIIAGPDFTIESGAEVYFKAGNFIRLLNEFTANEGSLFDAVIQ